MSDVSVHIDAAIPSERPRGRRRGGFALLLGVVTAVAAIILVYSQTQSFAWDEGFHLLAAQLIDQGKLPYVDYCYPQTPLNAFWVAFWMHVFSQSWRVAHIVASIETIGAIFLIGQFILGRFPDARWRVSGALAAAVFFGLSLIVVQYGTVAQAYGLCLLMIASAYRLAVLAAERKNLPIAAAAGLCAGISAGSSLLTAPIGPVIFVWLLVYSEPGRRISKAAAFAIGEAAAFLPVLWLYIKFPQQTVFNVLAYNMSYRRLDWPGNEKHNWEEITSWMNSPQALILISLAVLGAVFVMRRSGWERARKAEYYLCAWLVPVEALYLCTPHPTFLRYFLFTVPFLSILSVAGLYAVANMTNAAARPWRPILLTVLVFSLSFARSMYDEKVDAFGWSDMEEIAQKVKEVTPPDATLWADEQIFFLLKRPVPEGMETADSHKLQFPPAKAALLHVVPRPELYKQVKAGYYHTVATCGDDDLIAQLGLLKLYAHKADIEDCSVFWDVVPKK
ncbi:MAG TPA: hypothetical protein VH325_10915 [Bryobacteraceae bacterium]|nr:hypothetical protein [Bryobacteraceae bacterium]